MRMNRVAGKSDPRLQEAEWDRIDYLFFDPPPGPFGGRPRASSRACFEAVWWVRARDGKWDELPRQYPSVSTCLRRFREWQSSGIWRVATSRLNQSRGQHV